MKMLQRSVLTVLCGLIALCASCVEHRAVPAISLYEGDQIREVPARDFDEASYLKRGYMKNTDPKGNIIYVYLPETDRPYEPVIGGNTGQGILWYGDRGGGQGRGGMGAVGMGGGSGSYN